MRHAFRPAAITPHRAVTFHKANGDPVLMLNAVSGLMLPGVTADSDGAVGTWLGEDEQTSLVLKDGATTVSTSSPVPSSPGTLLVQAPDYSWHHILVDNSGVLSTEPVT